VESFSRVLLFADLENSEDKSTANTNTFTVFKYFYAIILNQRIHSNYNLQTLFSVYYHGDQAIFVTIIYIIMYLQIGNLPRNNNN
jgi:uncharacterized MAPEG superfamily protein